MGKFDNPRLFNPGLLGLENTLLERLNPVVDVVRDVGVRLGTRQYQVAMIWGAWSGGQRHYGDLTIVQTHTILPTPLVTPEVIRNEFLQAGTIETGNLIVTEISPRYTEDFLAGRDVTSAPGVTIPSDVEFWYEVTRQQPGASLAEHRRFTPLGPPIRDLEKAGWKMTLQRADAPAREAGYVP